MTHSVTGLTNLVEVCGQPFELKAELPLLLQPYCRYQLKLFQVTVRRCPRNPDPQIYQDGHEHEKDEAFLIRSNLVKSEQCARNSGNSTYRAPCTSKKSPLAVLVVPKNSCINTANIIACQ